MKYYRQQDKPLKLQCNNCGGQLQILGKIGYQLHTKCVVCGADSASQIKAHGLKKTSGVQTIPVLRRKVFRKIGS